jgi:hypothetical protein
MNQAGSDCVLAVQVLHAGSIIMTHAVEQDRNALLSHYAQVAVEHLGNLEQEERNRVYKMLDLKVLAQQDGNLEVKWVLGGNPCRDNEPLLPGSSRIRGT